MLCKVFARKCVKNAKTSDILPIKENNHNFRQPEKYKVYAAIYKQTCKQAQNLICKDYSTVRCEL